jgi:hypothetical protein
MTDTKEKVDELIWDDHCLITDDPCATVGIGTPAVIAIIVELGYRKFEQGGCQKCSL